MNSGAEFSDCGKYRYLLFREWDSTKPTAMCIGLNPSTANAEKDDPTIHLLISKLTELGFGKLNMTNLFALVTPNPDDLRRCPDPVKQNDAWLNTTAFNSQVIIFCWGNFPMAHYRAKIVRPMFPDAKCFGFTKDKNPIHPRFLMYRKEAVKLIDYNGSH